MVSHKALCLHERGESAGQSANESRPLNELLSIHNVCTHKSHSVDCGSNKYVCSLSINLSSPLSESFLTWAWIKPKHNFSLTHVIAVLLPFAHYLDHMGTISSIYLYHDSVTLLCVQQSSHCPCWEQETMSGSLSLHTQDRKIHQDIREENSANISTYTKAVTAEMFGGNSEDVTRTYK